METLVKYVQDEFISQNEHPSFKSGDTITVYYEIKEGEKSRTQFFKGVVIQIKELERQKLLQLERCQVQLVLKEFSQSTFLRSKKLK